MGDPILHSVFDWAYNGVMQYAPEYLQDREMFSAFTLGFIGGTATIGAMQGVSYLIDKYAISDFNEEWAPKIEKAGFYVALATPLAYSILDPEGAKTLFMENPVYTSGVLGGWAGAVTRAGMDLNKRANKKREQKQGELEQIVEDMRNS